MEKQVVERCLWIAAPPERIWQALTDPEQVVQWFVPNLPGAQMKRDDRGKVQIYIGEMGVDFVLLEMIEPQRTMRMYSLPDQLLAVTYTLEEERGGTAVTVTVSGFEALPPDQREDRQGRMGVAWDQTLQNLQAYVGGAELPFPQAYIGPLFGYWRDPGQQRAIERSIWIAAPAERVWRALTDPQQLQQWLSPTTAWELSALEVGGRFYVRHPETNSEMSVETITVLDPPHRLVTRAVPEPPDTVVKDKAYRLQEEQGGTRLTVTLSGYEQEPSDTRERQMEENAFGFGMMLQNTKAYLEGENLPFPWGF
jgi:uncharacterized protein YndB with AHSA1/START domain